MKKTGVDIVDDDKLALICRVVHEALRAFKAGIGQADLPTWKRAPKWMKSATRDSVLSVIQNPDQTSKFQHEQWVAQKRADGWKYGKTKDTKAKTHPLLIPYEELDPNEQLKDALLIATVKAFVPLGFDK